MATTPSATSESAAIALVGDRDATVTAHPAIERTLDALGAAWRWLPTPAVGDPTVSLAHATGVWVVPASPYRSLEGALAAIRCARVSGRPLLGTCGGFQHLLLECARNVLGETTAAHAEYDPATPDPVCTALPCSLVEVRGAVRFVAGSRLQALLGERCEDVGYHCRFGLSPAWRTRLETTGLVFSGFDPVTGEVRAAEFSGHPFCVGTLFQPERAILHGPPHPLVAAFVRATRGNL